MADGGRTDLCGLDRLHAFVAHMLDTTGKEHVNRHKEYLKLRVVDGRSASYAARNMGLAILLVLPLLWCVIGVLTATVIRSGGAQGIVVAVWAAAGLVALALVALRLCARSSAAAAVAGEKAPSARSSSAKALDAKRQSSREATDAFRSLWMLAWIYVVLLFLVPATLMVTQEDLGARGGGYLFLMTLWLTGWGHNWVSHGQVDPIDDQALMPSVPDGLTFRLRVVAVMYEGYVACSFSFFPALPWKETSVPKPVINFFEAAVFDFGLDAHYISFFTACGFVPVSFAALVLVKHHGGAEQFLMVVDLAFDALTFPICKTLVGVLSCTGGNLREQTRTYEAFPEGNTTTYLTSRVCGGSVAMEASCMDGRPDVECWGDTHMWHVLGVFLFLVPYYIGGAKLRTEAQKQTSTVVIDSIFSVLAFQLKFLLAVIASGFGSCHPWMLVVSVEMSVLVMLVVVRRRRFSNTIQLTALRVGGLTAAGLNGFVAAFVAWRLKPDSCEAFASEEYSLAALLPDDRGINRVLVKVEEMHDASGNVVRTTIFPPDAPPLHEIDEINRNAKDFTQDYTDLILLIAVNSVVIVFAALWYYRAVKELLKKWERVEPELEKANEIRVDYPIVRQRLTRMATKDRNKARAKFKVALLEGIGQSRSMGVDGLVKLEHVRSTEGRTKLNGFMMCVSQEDDTSSSKIGNGRAAGKQLEDLVSKNDEFCFKMMNLVFKTRNCVSKTRKFVNMMNFADDRPVAFQVEVVQESPFPEG